MASKPILRNDLNLHDDILGKLKTDIKTTVGCQLPSKGDFVRHYFFLKRGDLRNNAQEEVVTIILQKIKLIWDKAAIPTKDVFRNPSPRKQGLDLIQNVGNLVRHKKRSNFKTELESFNNQLDELFDISAHNAVEIIQKDSLRNAQQKDEDILFLNDQKTTRRLVLGNIDTTYTSKIRRKLSRMSSGTTRLEKERMKLQEVSSQNQSDDEFSDGLPGTSTDNYIPSSRVMRSSRTMSHHSWRYPQKRCSLE